MAKSIKRDIEINMKGKIILELKKQDDNRPDEVFYRYRCGRYTFWFTQYQDNGKKTHSQNCMGCIFKVSVASDSNGDFELQIDEPIGEDRGYPTRFRISGLDYSVNLEDIESFTSRLLYAKEYLKTIEDFFFNSDHYELFKKRTQLE